MGTGQGSSKAVEYSAHSPLKKLFEDYSKNSFSASANASGQCRDPVVSDVAPWDTPSPPTEGRDFHHRHQRLTDRTQEGDLALEQGYEIVRCLHDDSSGTPLAPNMIRAWDQT